MASVWNQIEQLTQQYRATAGTALNVHQFNLFAVTHHSTSIEGSTLTLEETNALLEKGISIHGKPILHQNMVLDHQEALAFVLQRAKEKKSVTIELITDIAAKTMRRTGKTVNSILGNTDETKGDLRKVNVSAGGYYFVDQAKVGPMMSAFVSQLDKQLPTVKTTEEVLTLAFTSHFDLVTIHPFTDGNGRVSRLLMNYIEAFHGQELTIVHAEDRPQYMKALMDSRELNSTDPIIDFLARQHIKQLHNALTAFQKSQTQDLKNSDHSKGKSIFF